MRSLLDTEEEEETKQAEITLSTASLLGIFFGLVLVCGVFFGFGYSMGRGTPAHPSSANAAPAANEDGPTPVASTVASEPEKEPTPEASTPAAEDKTQEAEATPPAPAPAPAPAQSEASAAPVHPSRPAAGRPISTPPVTPVLVQQPMMSPAVSGKPMVQIAAVARREDADVLVTALKQRGYGVVVRVEPQDNLLHVQVGPFADRSQAMAMRQKLLSDGYNAIIKQ
jgi:cell division septation protein DedD